MLKIKRNIIFIVLFISLFFIDQKIKFLFVNGSVWHWECISLILTYNYGVAFSMFSFLQEYLKYIQILLLAIGFIYLYNSKDIFSRYSIPIALLLAGGTSNIYDRFIHGGVVDYIYWHCWFDFAIFNLADILIDIAVVWILFINYLTNKLKI